MSRAGESSGTGIVLRPAAEEIGPEVDGGRIASDFRCSRSGQDMISGADQRALSFNGDEIFRAVSRVRADGRLSCAWAH